MLEITVKLVRKINSAGWAMCISTTTAMLTKTQFKNLFTNPEELLL